jgi:hypothetical protein
MVRRRSRERLVEKLVSPLATGVRRRIPRIRRRFPRIPPRWSLSRLSPMRTSDNRSFGRR